MSVFSLLRCVVLAFAWGICCAVGITLIVGIVNLIRYRWHGWPIS